VAPDNFMHELRAICDRHGILLVVDEVQCGAGVRANGGHRALRRGADMVCMAKASPAACLWHLHDARGDYDWVPGSHASTFGGNPVPSPPHCHMDIIEREAMANATRVGGLMQERLRGWVKRIRWWAMCATGLMIGISW